MSEILLSTFEQKPQPALEEGVKSVECEYFPGEGAIFDKSYSKEKGMEVYVSREGGESKLGHVNINLDKDRLGIDNMQDYKLIFEFRSERISFIIVKFATFGEGHDGGMEIEATWKSPKLLPKDSWKRCEVMLNKDFAQIQIHPQADGVFYIRDMKVIKKDTYFKDVSKKEEKLDGGAIRLILKEANSSIEEAMELCKRLSKEDEDILLKVTEIGAFFMGLPSLDTLSGKELDIRSYRNLGLILHRQGLQRRTKFEEAKKCFRNALELCGVVCPSTDEVCYCPGKNMSKATKEEGMLVIALAKAYRHNKQRELFSTSLLEQLTENKDNEVAIAAWIESGLYKPPDNPDNAYKDYQEAKRLCSDEIHAWIKVNVYLAMGTCCLNQVHKQPTSRQASSKLEEANNYAQQAEKIAKDSGSKYKFFDALNLLSHYYFATGEYQNCINTIEEILDNTENLRARNGVTPRLHLAKAEMIWSQLPDLKQTIAELENSLIELDKIDDSEKIMQEELADAKARIQKTIQMIKEKIEEMKKPWNPGSGGTP